MTEDQPGDSSRPDGPSGPVRRSRRAGRSSESYDFRARFGEPAAPTERREGLREPLRRDESVRGRGRVTVRELMDQMGVDPASPTPPAPPAPTAPRSPERPRTPTPPPAPRRPAPAPRATTPPPVPEQPTPVPPPTPQRFVVPPVELPPMDFRPGAPIEATPPASTPPAPSTPPSPPVESTEWLPLVEDTPAVDLSAAATAERAQSESRGQGSTEQPHSEQHRPDRRSLEPTPDLTGAFEKVRRERSARRRPSFTRTAAQNAGRVLVALACVLTLLGTGYVWNLKRGWNGAWNNVAAIDQNDPNIRNKQAQYGDETYLIVGTDSRFGKNAKIGGGDSTTIEGIRADTILLVNIPADRSRVVAVSWPRDLQVDRPECQQWDPETGAYSGTLPAQDSVKLNSVYADGGPTCLVKTLTQMSGLNINHFIAMDFEGFEKVVNVIGGVEVCSTVSLYDYELGYILRRPGTKKLTGKRALNYVRARNISAEGNGDYGRIKRQQLFMASLLRATLSGDVLSNPAKLNRIVNTFIKYSSVDNVDTDSLISLADSMQGVDAGSVTFLTVPTSGTSTDGANNEIPRIDDIDAIFNAIIDDKPLPGEKKPARAPQSAGNGNGGNGESPATTTPRTTPSQADATAQYPSNVTVRVLNGSGEPGVATEVMNTLIAQGFTVPGVADASSNRDDTVVRYGPGEKDSAATVAKMFPGARIQEDRTVKVGVEIILGSDFTGTGAIASVPTPGSTLTVGQLPAANVNSDLPNDLSVTNAGDTTCS